MQKSTEENFNSRVKVKFTSSSKKTGTELAKIWITITEFWDKLRDLIILLEYLEEVFDFQFGILW